MNCKLSNWSYYQLEMLLEYKAEALGKTIEHVDARYTSQRCNKCGHIAKGNRKTQSDFRCQECRYEENADLNAARQGSVNSPKVLLTYCQDRTGGGASPLRS